MCFQSPSSLHIGLMKEVHQRVPLARLVLVLQLRQPLPLVQLNRVGQSGQCRLAGRLHLLIRVSQSSLLAPVVQFAQ